MGRGKSKVKLKKLTKNLLSRYKNKATSSRFTCVCLFPPQMGKIMFETFIFLVNPHVIATSYRTLYIHFVATYSISPNSKLTNGSWQKILDFPLVGDGKMIPEFSRFHHNRLPWVLTMDIKDTKKTNKVARIHQPD